MKILIIGSSGLVGGNIYQLFSDQTNWDLLGTYNEYDVKPFVHFNASDATDWSPVISETKWDVIIHTGALTHVDKCEENPDLSEFLTVQSTINLGKLAIKHKSKLIYISTDYIFDGKEGPYTENASPSPLCTYGEHKLASEKYIQENIGDYLILRVTNVYGDEVRGKNFLSRTINQIKNEAVLEVTAPSDQYATPVNAFDIARVILILIKDAKQGVYHIASTDFLNRVQFLNRINNYFDDKIRIKSIITANLNQAAKRPLFGGLIASRFLNEYPDFKFSNIDDYLQKYQ